MCEGIVPLRIRRACAEEAAAAGTYTPAATAKFVTPPLLLQPALAMAAQVATNITFHAGEHHLASRN